MQYALMIYPGPGEVRPFPTRNVTRCSRNTWRWPRMTAASLGARLERAEMATSVRVLGGRTVMTDGPFADTKEVLGGLLLIEAANLDEAIGVAERIPAARFGGAVEVRPVVPR